MPRFSPALLVVDMQYDFVHGSLAVPDGNIIIDTINSLLSLPFLTKIGSKDFHPPNHISFAKTHGREVFSTTTIYPPGATDGKRGLTQVLWPVHCVAGTDGSEFVDGLHNNLLDGVVYKGTDPGIEMYSAFRDPWHLSNTALPSMLEEYGITDVFIAGIAGDYCVKSTAFDAVDFGYKTWVIRDAIKSVGNTGKEWQEMEEKGIEIVDSVEIQAILTASRSQGL